MRYGEIERYDIEAQEQWGVIVERYEESGAIIDDALDWVADNYTELDIDVVLDAFRRTARFEECVQDWATND
jgi:hypothetical protein